MSEPLVGFQCWQCRHLREDYTCTAFPDGLPPEIIDGFDHSAPLAGDRGIRFEVRPSDQPPPEFVSLDLIDIEPSGQGAGVRFAAWA